MSLDAEDKKWVASVMWAVTLSFVEILTEGDHKKRDLWNNSLKTNLFNKLKELTLK